MDKVFELIEEEKRRQNNELCLIASENIVSKNVLKAMGSTLTNKYAEGYPGHRYYGGCEVVDKIEQYAIDKAKELFNCKWANVQPHSGSQANQAVYLALCKPRDTILGMDLNAGGHLTHGAKVSSSGKLYNSISYGLDENGIINYEEIKEKLYKYNPKLLIVGASAYPRIIDFERIRKIIDDYHKDMWEECNNDPCIKNNHPDIFFNGCRKCYLMVDMAHIAGLVATGLHPSPLPYADVVTSTTHKTLRGPRGGLILSNNEEIGKIIDKAVFPGIQGGPLEHIIAAKAICFEEALTDEYREYMTKVLYNIEVLETIFKCNGIDLISNESDNHLLLLNLTKFNISGKQVEDALHKVGIVVNKNMIYNDTRKPNETSGIRIGTANLTTRGLKEEDFIHIGTIIVNVIKELSQNTLCQELIEKYKGTVSEICRKYPLV